MYSILAEHAHFDVDIDIDIIDAPFIRNQSIDIDTISRMMQRMTKATSIPWLAVACAAIGLQGSPFTQRAFAQATDVPAQAPGVLEEIVVTARRETENLRKVPIAITAATADDIREWDIRSVTDLQRIVPSLTATGRLGQNEESLTLRGQRATGEFIGAGAGPAVVSYFAEVPSATTGPGLYLDLANVQVLKGPQGTLFGRNTTGGAVLYEPRRPEKELSGHAQAIGGDLGRLDVEGVLNVPLIDDVLLIRLAAQRQERGGLAIDVETGTEFNNRNNRTARLGVQFTPHERVSNYLALQSVRFKENGPATVLFAANPAALPLLKSMRFRRRSRATCALPGRSTRTASSRWTGRTAAGRGTWGSTAHSPTTCSSTAATGAATRAGVSTPPSASSSGHRWPSSRSGRKKWMPSRSAGSRTGPSAA